MRKSNWELKLKGLVEKNLPYYCKDRPSRYGFSEYHTIKCVSESGFEYELDVYVCASVERAQRGGRTDPSWDAYYCDVDFFWHRPNHGWKVVYSEDSAEEIAIGLFGDPAEFGKKDPDDYYDSRFDW